MTWKLNLKTINKTGALIQGGLTLIFVEVVLNKGKEGWE
jgi:hypothetical protein